MQAAIYEYEILSVVFFFNGTYRETSKYKKGFSKMLPLRMLNEVEVVKTGGKKTIKYLFTLIASHTRADCNTDVITVTSNAFP